MRKKNLFYKLTKIILVVLIYSFILTQLAFSQTVPGYGFINFTMNYNTILTQLKNKSFEIKEQEIASKYGNYLIFASKTLNYYTETFYLFFNEKKELIFFQVGFELNNLQSRDELEKLYISMTKKLEEKYGKPENENFPYFKMFENNYEITLFPLFPGANKIKLTYKYIEKFNEYQDYYKANLEKEVDTEINNIVNNL